MIALLTAAQIRQSDAYTIENEPISSVDLMERASKAFVDIFIKHYPNQQQSICVYCGTGNNGGDGLAIARLLKKNYYNKVNILVARFSDKTSSDFKINFEKLRHTGIKTVDINSGDEFHAEDADIIIDALLGSGLNKPLEGDYARLVGYINNLDKTVVAVDVPTGLYTDGEIPVDALVLKAKLVITFQQPKLNFLLPDSAPYMDTFKVANINLNAAFIQSLNSQYQLSEKADIRKLLKPRKPFEHKGTYGHALIIAGQQLTMGAALLCSSACAYTGAGLTTACIPEGGLTGLNTAHPEIMAIVRDDDKLPEIEWGKFTAIAIGPGLGKSGNSLQLIQHVFNAFDKPVVIDADALNLLSENKDLLKNIPKGSIITPHMKEFDRLFGEHKNWWSRLQTLSQQARELQINIVLKNRYTIIGTPEGGIYFNPTGNPAMGSGGMGDVLTGVIVSLLAQKYTPQQACIIGTYLHGKAGDEVAQNAAVVLAGQLAARIPATLAKLKA